MTKKPETNTNTTASPDTSAAHPGGQGPAHPAHAGPAHPAHPGHGHPAHPGPVPPGKKGGGSPIDIRLFASMERATLERALASVQVKPSILPGGIDLVKLVITQDPETLDAITLPLGRIVSAVLPLWQLDPVVQGVYLRQLFPCLSSFVVSVCDAQTALSHGPVKFQMVDTGQLQDLMSKRGTYSAFMLLGMKLNNAGLSQRQISGAFLIFTLDRVLTVLNRRLSDPNEPKAKKDQLLADFAPAILEMDAVLQNPVQRKADLGGQRTIWAQKADDAQAEAALQEMALRVRQNLVLPRQGLFDAARRHQAQKPQAPGLLSDSPWLAPTGPSGHPKII